MDMELRIVLPARRHAGRQRLGDIRSGRHRGADHRHAAFLDPRIGCNVPQHRVLQCRLRRIVMASLFDLRAHFRLRDGP